MQLNRALTMQRRPARTVVVSSRAHEMGSIDLQDLHYRRRRYTAWGAYGECLLCNATAPSSVAAAVSCLCFFYEQESPCNVLCPDDMLSGKYIHANSHVLFHAGHTKVLCRDCWCCCRAIKARQHPVCKAACREPRGHQCESLLIASRQAVSHSIKHALTCLAEHLVKPRMSDTADIKYYRLAHQVVVLLGGTEACTHCVKPARRVSSLC